MDKQCSEAEGARLLKTMRRICDATGCVEVEHATLAYEEALQDVAVKEKACCTTYAHNGIGISN